MNDFKSSDMLHGKTLQVILEHLVETYGFVKMGAKIPVKCFNVDPSISSSLKFLRKTPWARKKVEDMYIRSLSQK